MLSRLASYLLRGSASGTQDEDVVSQDNAENSTKEIASIPVEARLRQVEVEGDEWILIDRNGEGFTGLDESWYVTPPACFTQPGPVHVEMSPLENLLIEHPSMSVYRAAGPPATTDKPKKQRSAKRCSPVPEGVKAPDPRLPLVPCNANLQTPMQQQRRLSVTAAGAIINKPFKPEGINQHQHHYHHRHHHHHHHQQQQQQAVVAAEQRRPGVRELRGVQSDENVRMVQIRSAQKMLEKRSSQSVKRNRLERDNKVREVSSGKGRRPRRQDRLRLNNSGANNNRKC